jgi:hypothetical protein
MDRLRILPADRGRAGGEVRPFRSDIDDAIAEAQLGMAEIAVLVGDDHAALEPERLLQPIERRPRIPVEHARGQRRPPERIVHEHLLHD